MKKGVLILTLIAVPLLTHAEGLAAVLRLAREVNETYLELQVDVELAELRYEKARIDARDRVDALTAESTYLGAQADHLRSLQSFYAEVVDAVYGAVIADYDRQVAERNEELARNEEAATEVRYRNGLVPEGDLIDARISVRSAAVEREERSWQYSDALDALADATGRTLEEIAIPTPPSFSPGMNVDEWIAADPGVARARIGQEIAEVRLARLPANAPEFDRMTLETELERARLATDRAINASERTYESLERRLKTLPQILTIRTEQLQLNEALHREAQERFDRGLITAVQRDQTFTRVLAARRNLVDSQKNYVRVVLEYAALAGIDPEEIL